MAVLELESDLAGDSTISTLVSWLVSSLASCSRDGKARYSEHAWLRDMGKYLRHRQWGKCIRGCGL